MIQKLFFLMAAFILSLAPFSTDSVLAQNKVVVVPLMEEKNKCECKGELSPGGRWCDQNDGTVLDMTNCLVWLKYASWGDRRPWLDCSTFDDAHTRAASLRDGTQIGYDLKPIFLNDGSDAGDWRLPTRDEFARLASGTEPVSPESRWKFNGVKNDYYWTGSTVATEWNFAWTLRYGLEIPIMNSVLKYSTTPYVWPVRCGN
jgi:hypothetical protein